MATLRLSILSAVFKVYLSLFQMKSKFIARFSCLSFKSRHESNILEIITVMTLNETFFIKINFTKVLFCLFAFAIFQSASENDKYCRCVQNFDLSLLWVFLFPFSANTGQKLLRSTAFLKTINYSLKICLTKNEDFLMISQDVLSFKSCQFFCHLCLCWAAGAPAALSYPKI